MAPNLTHALRLFFVYQSGHIRLIGAERIAMIVPAPVTPLPASGQTGYWFAVLDATGRVLYHRPLHRPVKLDVETFSPEARQSISRMPVAELEGQFTVLIPDVENARAFELHGPADPRRPDEPAVELLRLDIDSLRTSNPPQRTGGTTPPGIKKG